MSSLEKETAKETAAAAEETAAAAEETAATQ